MRDNCCFYSLLGWAIKCFNVLFAFYYCLISQVGPGQARPHHAPSSPLAAHQHEWESIVCWPGVWATFIVLDAISVANAKRVGGAKTNITTKCSSPSWDLNDMCLCVCVCGQQQVTVAAKSGRLCENIKQTCEIDNSECESLLDDFKTIYGSH